MAGEMNGKTDEKMCCGWLFPTLTANGLLLFLVLSFASYHRRRMMRRKTEDEYYSHLSILRPSDRTFTRARSILTNTHINHADVTYIYNDGDFNIENFEDEIESMTYNEENKHKTKEGGIKRIDRNKEESITEQIQDQDIYMRSVEARKHVLQVDVHSKHMFGDPVEPILNLAENSTKDVFDEKQLEETDIAALQDTNTASSEVTVEIERNEAGDSIQQYAINERLGDTVGTGAQIHKLPPEIAMDTDCTVTEDPAQNDAVSVKLEGANGTHVHDNILTSESQAGSVQNVCKDSTQDNLLDKVTGTYKLGSTDGPFRKNMGERADVTFHEDMDAVTSETKESNILKLSGLKKEVTESLLEKTLITRLETDSSAGGIWKKKSELKPIISQRKKSGILRSEKRDVSLGVRSSKDSSVLYSEAKRRSIPSSIPYHDELEISTDQNVYEEHSKIDLNSYYTDVGMPMIKNQKRRSSTAEDEYDVYGFREHHFKLPALEDVHYKHQSEDTWM